MKKIMATIGQRYDPSNCPKIKCKIQRNGAEMQRNEEKCRGIQRVQRNVEKHRAKALPDYVLYD